jgi:cytosine/adenosine deaminase-related metal-dependent hydrolase
LSKPVRLPSCDGRIAFVGALADLPCRIRENCRKPSIVAALDHPGLIDCHTHLVHSPATAPMEFEMRLAGATYEEDRTSRRRHHLLGPATQREARKTNSSPSRCRGSIRCWPKAFPPSKSNPAMASNIEAN